MKIDDYIVGLGVGLCLLSMFQGPDDLAEPYVVGTALIIMWWIILGRERRDR